MSLSFSCDFYSHFFITRRKGCSVFHSRKNSLLFKGQGVQLIRKHDQNTIIIHVFRIYVYLVVPVSNLWFARYAQDFFKQLVSPTEFPRGKNFVHIYITHNILISTCILVMWITVFTDYVGFIKKIMKLMQLTYPMFRKIEVSSIIFINGVVIIIRKIEFIIMVIHYSLFRWISWMITGGTHARTRTWTNPW